MSEERITAARELIFSWREDDSADFTVRTDKVEELLRFVRQQLRRRLGSGITFSSLCPDCNRRSDNETLHPRSSVCLSDTKSDGQEYIKELLGFLESAMKIYDALTDVREVEEVKDELRDATTTIAKLEGEKEELISSLAETELSRDSAEFELSELKADVEEKQKEYDEEFRKRDKRDADVRLLLSVANTAVKYRDAESLRIFKAKLKEVESSFYPGIEVEEAWAEDDDIIVVDEVVEDPPHASSDSATWSLPPIPDAIAERRKRFGPIGGKGKAPSRSSSAGSSKKSKASKSRRRHRSSSSSSTSTVRPVKAVSLKDKGEKGDSLKKKGEDDDGDGEKKGEDDDEKKESGKVEVVEGKEEDVKGGGGEEKKKGKKEKEKKKAPLPDDYFDDVDDSSSSSSEDEEEPKARYPSFDDPPPGVELKHCSGGYLCGGWGNAKRVSRMIKATESVKFDEVKKGKKECLNYLSNEARFNAIVKGMITRDTNLYDLLSVFNTKCTHWRYSLEPLLAKQKYYISFKHFLREFQVKRFPMIREESRNEAINCCQAEGEEIAQYYERWSELQKLMGWSLEDRCDSFINGLRSNTIKRLISLENYSTEARTIDQVKDHAVYLSGRLEVTDAQGTSSRRTVAAASTPSTSASKPRQKAKKQRAESAAGGSAPTSAASTSVEARLAQSKRWMRNLGLTGCCWVCFRHHAMTTDQALCESKCIFCNRVFSKNDRHFPFECQQKPSKDAAIISLWKRIKSESKKNNGAK